MVNDQDPLDPVLQALLKNRMDPILYKTHVGDIQRSVAHKLRHPMDHPEVDDGVQETFIRAYRSIGKKSDDELSHLARDGGIIKWLHKIADNVVKDIWEKNSHVIKLSPPKNRKDVSNDQGQPEDEKGTVVFVLKYLNQSEDGLEHDIPDENAGSPEDIVVNKEEEEENAKIESERYDIVSCAVEALPQVYRTSLSLRYSAGDKLSPEDEIAQKMGVTVGVIKARISRALEKVRKYVAVQQYLAGMDESTFEETVSLPEICKKVLMLHFYERLAWNHITQQCGLKKDENQVKKVLHRGIELLLQLSESKKGKNMEKKAKKKRAI